MKSIDLPSSFSIQHISTGLYISSCSIKLCLKGTLYDEKYKFNIENMKDNGNYTAIKIVDDNKVDGDDNLYIRSFESYLIPFELNNDILNHYLYEFIKIEALNNIYNINSLNGTLGYDYYTDSIILVSLNDERKSKWRIIDNNAIAETVEYSNFMLKDNSSGRVLSRCDEDLCLNGGEKLVLSLEDSDYIKDYSMFGYQTLRVIGEEPLYLRQDGYVLHADTLIGNQIDFAFLMEKDSETVVFHHPFGGFKYDLGYDEDTNKVLIIRRGDSRVVNWEVVYI